MNLTELITELAAADGIGHIGTVREVAKKYLSPFASSLYHMIMHLSIIFVKNE